MDPNIMTLTEPIEHGKETISELTFRKPVVRDYRAWPVGANPTIGQLLDVASLLCGQPPVVLGKMGGADTLAVVEIVTGFFQPGSKTGEKPSL